MCVVGGGGGWGVGGVGGVGGGGGGVGGGGLFGGGGCWGGGWGGGGGGGWVFFFVGGGFFGVLFCWGVSREFSAPARQRAGEGQGLGFKDRAGHGAGEAIGGEGADASQGDRVDFALRPRGGGGENRVAVHRGVDRAQGAREAVLRHDRHAFGLRLGQGGVGGDNGDIGVSWLGALHLQRQRALGQSGGPAEAAEFAVALIGRGPEMRGFADGRLADGVGRHQRADAETVLGHGAGRAEAALEIGKGRAMAGPETAEPEIQRGRIQGYLRGLLPQPPIGRLAPEVLVAAVDEVEQYGARNDRHELAGDLEAAARRTQGGLDAADRVEPESRAAGEDQRVDLLHRHVGFEQGGVAQARRAARNGERGRRRRVENQRRDSGGEFRVMGRADLDAGDIGDQVAHRAAFRIETSTKFYRISLDGGIRGPEAGTEKK